MLTRIRALFRWQMVGRKPTLATHLAGHRIATATGPISFRPLPEKWGTQQTLIWDQPCGSHAPSPCIITSSRYESRCRLDQRSGKFPSRDSSIHSPSSGPCFVYPTLLPGGKFLVTSAKSAYNYCVSQNTGMDRVDSCSTGDFLLGMPDCVRVHRR